MKRLSLLGLIFCLCIFVTPTKAADDEFFYRLGGGVPIGSGPTNRTSTVRFGTGLAWNSDLTCGNFDINTSITNQLNGLSGAFQNLMGNVIQTASGVVASLPALVIQRLNPGLYDLLQNGVLQAGEEFHLAEASCEAIVGQMSTTIESEGWDGLARSGWWRQEAQAGTADILDVKDAAETAGLDAGVPWVGGVQAGGAGQPAIEVTEDAAVAGMNLILGRNPDDVSAVPVGVCNGARICETWASPCDCRRLGDGCSGRHGDSDLPGLQQGGDARRHGSTAQVRTGKTHRRNGDVADGIQRSRTESGNA